MSCVCLALVIPVAHAADSLPAASRLTIAVDPRIELVAAVSLLAGDRPGWTPRDESPYRQRLRAFAKPYADHEAVAVMRAIEGFAYSYPAEAILHFGPPPALEPTTPVPDSCLEAIGGKAVLDRWIDGLRRFARDAKFDAFFAGEKAEFDRMAARTRATLGAIDIPGAFESYYGLQPQQYTLVLAPNLLPGAFGPSVPLPDGTRHFYSIQGAAGVVEGYPHFGNAASIASLSWHEFGHSVVNPLTTANRARLATSEALFRSMKTEMEKAAYGTWEIATNEILVRAAAMRIAATALKGDQALQAIATQLAASATLNVYVYRMADLLQTFYEKSRATWPGYAAFYPVNLILLDALAKEL